LNQIKIFIVEDDVMYSRLLSHHLSKNPDYQVHVFNNGKDCVSNLYRKPSVICLDYSLPDISGLEVLQKVRNFDSEIKVLIISGQEDISTAVQLLKEGAYDYITKDDDTKTRLWNSIKNLRENIDLKEQIKDLRKEISTKYDFQTSIIGNSQPMKKVFSLVEKSIKTNITVSISGETGTGKELVAKAIAYNSARADKPFVVINVSAIPEELIESEMFGHEKGAFTGANTRRIGKFEQANKGTLFLDEIGEMSLNMQSKLLRTIQEKEIVRVGGNETIKFDTRIIVATHRNLRDEVSKGNFREDLYYRLLGLPIELPPLRDRGSDIILLAKYFVKEFCKENEMPDLIISKEAQEKLLNYSFPGNVRELKAIMDLAAVMAEGDTIHIEDINLQTKSELANLLLEERTLKEYEVEIIKSYLKKYENDVLKVAKLLDIGKSTIYRMKKKGEL